MSSERAGRDRTRYGEGVVDWVHEIASGGMDAVIAVAGKFPVDYLVVLPRSRHICSASPSSRCAGGGSGEPGRGGWPVAALAEPAALVL